MAAQGLIEEIASSVGDVPREVDVLTVRRLSREELEMRVRRLIHSVQEAYELRLERVDRIVRDDLTVLRMPGGSRLTIYQASGAMKFVAGLNPMESLFEKVDSLDELVRLVEKSVERTKVLSLAGPGESIRFERLWRIKASAADRRGKVTKPILCRVVGAFRHVIRGIPVWGPASVAIKLAGGMRLDSLTVQVRETTGEIVDRVAVLPPVQAVRQIIMQARSLIGTSKTDAGERIEPLSLRFGYLGLPKRKSQHFLAPVYISEVRIRGDEPQAYLLAVPASETSYAPLCMHGVDAAAIGVRGVAEKRSA